MKYLLDTHTWIWWQMCPEKLSDRVRSIIGDIEGYDEIFLSAISLWEFSKLVETGRIGISCDPLIWLHEALLITKLKIAPLALNTAYLSTVLPAPFHGDPADQILVATARAEGAVILTKDKRILEYKHVESLW